MKIIKRGEKYDVIYKYSQEYIRFIGGQMMPIPCDIKISKEECDNILCGKRSMEEIVKHYMEIIPWTESEFMKRGYTDYFESIYNMSTTEIEGIMNKLNKNKALKNEMYISIMTEKFPVNCWAKVDGLKASDYSKMMGTDLNKTYMYMIEKM